MTTNRPCDHAWNILSRHREICRKCRKVRDMDHSKRILKLEKELEKEKKAKGTFQAKWMVQRGFTRKMLSELDEILPIEVKESTTFKAFKRHWENV